MAIALDSNDSKAGAPVDSARPANDVPALSVPELAGNVIRRVMRTLEENPGQDPIPLLRAELEDIESKSD